MDCSVEELNLRVAVADLRETGAEIHDCRIVRIKQPPLRKERVHEGIVNRTLDDLAELRSRHQKRVDVHTIRVQRHVRRAQLLVIDGYQNQIDIRFGPHGVVRKTTAENRRNDGAVTLHLLDQSIQRPAEFLLDPHPVTLSDFRGFAQRCAQGAYSLLVRRGE